MAKPLDPKKIESARQFSSRAERREQRRKLMQDEIAENQRSNGVIVILPKKVAGSAARAPKTACCGVLPRQHTGRRTGWQF